MKYVYKIWCEWDIGQDDVVYGSKFSMSYDMAYAMENIFKDSLNYGETIHEFFDGLIGYDTIELIY